jgi:hypothetical protein
MGHRKEDIGLTLQGTFLLIQNELYTIMPIVNFLPIRNDEKKGNDKL